MSNIRAIAFYLPQFHPIPENDQWWGKGFTEWTNVTKAKPLFKGHVQPNLPGELGFYDLRVPETRESQAQLAKQYGIEGFCYWHYWFGNGKRILDKIFEEVLVSGKPDFPFCLAWANETWTGIWHGAKDTILIEQTYPGEEDFKAHFSYLIRAFQDKRYIRVNNKPLFLVYKPHLIPNIELFVNTFRAEAKKAGLDGIYLVGNNSTEGWNPLEHGFDATAPTALHRVSNDPRFHVRLRKKIKRTIFPSKTYHVYEYKDAIKRMLIKEPLPYPNYPCVLPNWDNTPRSGTAGWVLKNSTPELFRAHLKEAIGLLEPFPRQQKLLFLKSWNEWAEGNYLEPDSKHGRAYLEVLKEEIDRTHQ